jgi:GT2 family glycosyltransferase
MTRLATVVVLNWNGRRLLPDCLDALAKQDLDPALWQAWVVDNGSTDDSLELLASDYPTVRVVETGANLGFAGGNNVALRMVDTPFVVLLNNDAHPEPDWLRRLLDAAQAPDASRVAAVSSKVLFEPRFVAVTLETPEFRAPSDPRELGVQVSRISLDGTDVTDEVLWDHGAYGTEGAGDGDARYRWTRPAGRILVPLPRELPTGDLRLTIRARAETTKPLTLRWDAGRASVEVGKAYADHTVVIPAGTAPALDVINNVGSWMHEPGYSADRGFQEPDTGQYDTPEDVFLMCAAAVSLRTSALEEVGIFDDDFFMYYEDTDLSWRLQAAGWDIRYAPDAVVRHLHSASSGEWSPFFSFHVERNRLLVFTKNAPAGYAFRLLIRFKLTTLSMVRRIVLQTLRQRRRPHLAPLGLRLKVLASYARLLPSTLRKRRAIHHAPHRDPQSLFTRWLQPPP